jgi:S-adenosylmethionine:tRNA ribosyltransferase-isomerase
MSDIFSNYNFSATPEHFKGEHREASEVGLIVVDARAQTIKEDTFLNLGNYFGSDDVLAVNQVGMGPSRLQGETDTGQFLDICFLMLDQPESDHYVWDVVILGEQEPPKQGRFTLAGAQVTGTLLGKTQDFDGPYWIEKGRYTGYRGRVRIEQPTQTLYAVLNAVGLLMHPWYTDLNRLAREKLNPETTVFNNAVHVSEPARRITKAMYDSYSSRGIDTLDFSLSMCFSWQQSKPDTRLEAYRMNHEEYVIPEASVALLEKATKARRNIVSIGTSGARVLESLGRHPTAGQARTDIFISPGFKFQYCSSLLTNLHNPMGTHVIMACAFGGRDLVLEACEQAARADMRFGIHGDSMLILGDFEPGAWQEEGDALPDRVSRA